MIKRWLSHIKQRVIKNRIARQKKVQFGCSVLMSGSRFEGLNMVGNNSRVTNCYLGIGSYVGDNCWINNVKMGNYCSIAPFVKMGFGTHPSSVFVSTHPAFYYNTSSELPFTFHKEVKQLFETHKFASDSYLVEIGSDVWIGADVKIMDGVKIGHGAIVVAGAVVTKDVAPFTIVGGIPAKEIRSRFTNEQVQFLLNDKWWERKIEDIALNYKKYTNIDQYVNYYSL